MDTVKATFKPYDYKTPNWSLQGRTFWARLVDMYDADTMTLILPLQTGFYKFSGRVYGIDTSEMKSKLVENKVNANKARNRMLQLCSVPEVSLEKIYTRKEVQAMLSQDVFLVWVKCGDWDKYGRLLVQVYKNDIEPKELGTILIEENLAYPYFGETKLTENQQATTLKN
jgi:endonuclease YncB( thermonuclease family)